MGCTGGKNQVIENKEVRVVPTKIHIDKKLKEALIARHKAKNDELKKRKDERAEKEKLLVQVLLKKNMEAPTLHLECNKLYKERSRKINY